MSESLDDTTSPSALAQNVVRLLYHYRRIDDSIQAENDPCATVPCDTCFSARNARIEHFIGRREPIHFILPAFPAKSPNRQKVISTLPDLGEQLSLSFLQSLCDYIGHLYSPGARITICSDGHVFGDVVGVTDTAVTTYRATLNDMITTAHWRSLELFGLDDAFGGTDYPKMRSMLDEGYASTLGELKARVRADDEARSLFNGIHRFMFEDAVARMGADRSRTRLRNASKEAAYDTILRSNAWSRLVAENFPTAVRLSIHPQPSHSEKFGLQLMQTEDGWLTPWHGAVLDDGESRYLVKRWDAEARNASMVWRHSRPSHFVAPPVVDQPLQG